MVRFLRNERRETGNVIIPSAANLNFAFSFPPPPPPLSIAKYRRRPPIFFSLSLSLSRSLDIIIILPILSKRMILLRRRIPIESILLVLDKRIAAGIANSGQFAADSRFLGKLFKRRPRNRRGSSRGKDDRRLRYTSVAGIYIIDSDCIEAR